MIEKLNAGFVNTWVLRNDLMRYAGVGPAAASAPASQAAERAREVAPGKLSADALAFAKRVHEHYTYPVDSLVFDADGQFVADLVASDLLMDMAADQSYLKLLGKVARPAARP